MEKKKTFYLRIRPELLDLAKSVQERSVLIAMLGHCDNGNGVCFASLSTLEAEAMVRKKTVAAAIETTGIFECTGHRITQGGYVKEWKVKRKYKHLIIHKPRKPQLYIPNRFPEQSDEIEAKAVPNDTQKQLNIKTIIYKGEPNSRALTFRPEATEDPIVTFEEPNKVEETGKSQSNSCLPNLSSDPKLFNYPKSSNLTSWETYKKELIRKHQLSLLNMSPEQRDAMRRRDKILRYYQGQRMDNMGNSTKTPNISNNNFDMGESADEL